MKICPKCKQEKNESDFHKNIRKNGGLDSWCKICVAEAKQTHYAQKSVEILEKQRIWRLENPEKAKAKDKRNCEKNREKRIKATASWQKRNPEKVKEYRQNNKKRDAVRIANWAQENKDKRNASAAKRRSQKKAAFPTWADMDKIAVVYKKAKQFDLHVDHIVPLTTKSVCGLHVWNNLQLLDDVLNKQKSNITWPDMPTEGE